MSQETKLSPTEHPGIDAIPNVKEETGLYCWMDSTRPCSAECMAFIQPPKSADYIGQPWARCILLVNEHRKGKHLVILSEDVHKLRGEIQKRGQIDPPIVR